MRQHRLLTYAIATVWLVNGLFCKVLNWVPRHQLIVGRILGNEYAPELTKAIGLSELVMTVWVVSGIRSRLCTVVQVALVFIMNSIEFVMAPDLLLFGKLNAVYALLYIGVVCYTEFGLVSKLNRRNS